MIQRTFLVMPYEGEMGGAESVLLDRLSEIGGSEKGYGYMFQKKLRVPSDKDDRQKFFFNIEVPDEESLVRVCDAILREGYVIVDSVERGRESGGGPQ